MSLFSDMSAGAKVWIYQSNRAFTESEVAEMTLQLGDFARQWSAHGQALRAEASVVHQLFVVLMVDESVHNASGCSIDSSVHFIKSLEKQYGIRLFDRLSIAYCQGKNQAIQLSNRAEFINLLAKGVLTEDTLVFNNLVETKADFLTNWCVPLRESWHQQLVPRNV